MRFYTSCALHRIVYPLEAYWPHSSITHRDALIKALSQIRVDTTTTPKGLIHFLTTDRATCIAFSDDDLLLEGSDHVRPYSLMLLVQDVGCHLSY